MDGGTNRLPQRENVGLFCGLLAEGWRSAAFFCVNDRVPVVR
jgi:hypothetical protein